MAQQGVNLFDIINDLSNKPVGTSITVQLFYTNAPGVCNFVRMNGNGLEVLARSVKNGSQTRFIVTKSNSSQSSK